MQNTPLLLEWFVWLHERAGNIGTNLLFVLVMISVFWMILGATLVLLFRGRGTGFVIAMAWFSGLIAGAGIVIVIDVVLGLDSNEFPVERLLLYSLPVSVPLIVLAVMLRWRENGWGRFVVQNS